MGTAIFFLSLDILKTFKLPRLNFNKQNSLSKSKSDYKMQKKDPIISTAPLSSRNENRIR